MGVAVTPTRKGADRKQRLFGDRTRGGTFDALLVAMVKGPSYYDPRRHPERAPDLFARIAARLTGDEFARFMSGLADFTTYAKLITAMPTGLFVRALWDHGQERET